MTAQITNKTDSFTVYKDFRLYVPGEETVKLSKNFDNNGMNVTVKNNSSDSLTIKVLVGVYNENDTLNTAKLKPLHLIQKQNKQFHLQVSPPTNQFQYLHGTRI